MYIELTIRTSGKRVLISLDDVMYLYEDRSGYCTLVLSGQVVIEVAEGYSTVKNELEKVINE